jgi:hypothetical protein
MARRLAIGSIAFAIVLCIAAIVIALITGHQPVGVSIFVAYAAGAWAYAVLPRPRRVATEETEEIARRIGYVSYDRMAIFQYVIAPWAAALSAVFLLLFALAIALRG